MRENGWIMRVSEVKCAWHISEDCCMPGHGMTVYAPKYIGPGLYLRLICLTTPSPQNKYFFLNSKKTEIFKFSSSEFKKTGNT